MADTKQASNSSKLLEDTFNVQPGNKINIIVFIGLAILTLTPWIDSPLALLMGILFAQLFIHPFRAYNKTVVSYLLKGSVIGLGFGMNLYNAFAVGQTGFVLTVVSIFGTLILGWFFIRMLNVNVRTGELIASGTAICGGSAIAAVAPVIKAKEKDISIALGTVFILNAVALFLFPWMGRLLELSQQDFGLWAALAIHDTSSVVAAAEQYGNEALNTATVVKLSRALWIIPLSLLFLVKYKSSGKGVKPPYFILLFIVALIINSYVPAISSISPTIVTIAKTGLTLSLFLIGSSMNRTLIKNVGFRPFLLGLLLWLTISVGSLALIVC